eukprot:gene12380-26037_t
MGNGGVVRYMGGKSPNEYFKEVIQPEYGHLLKKLHMNDNRGLTLLKIFIKMDSNEKGELTGEEILDFFGGIRTKFIERIFAIYIDYTKPGVNFHFREYIITLWNFFSLNPRYLARFLFEMMDIDNHGVLEQPDLETIKTHLIQPAIDYQNQLIKLCGGSILWHEIPGYRRQKFMTYDNEAKTIEDALQAILEADAEVLISNDDDDADSQMKIKKDKLFEQIQNAQQESLVRDREKEEIRLNLLSRKPED